MPISNSYPKGVPIEDQDLFVGTKGSNNRTVNYTAQGVADYLNINSKVAIGGQMSFQFTVVPNIPKTISFEGGLGDGTAFSAITKLVVSAIDLSTANITIFLNYLNNSQVLLSQQNQPNFFGHYKITGYTQIGTSAFYELDLEFIGGNGTIGDKQYYDLVSFVLSAEVAVPNLQEVLTAGREFEETTGINRGIIKEMITRFDEYQTSKTWASTSAEGIDIGNTRFDNFKIAQSSLIWNSDEWSIEKTLGVYDQTPGSHSENRFYTYLKTNELTGDTSSIRINTEDIDETLNTSTNYRFKQKAITGDYIIATEDQIPVITTPTLQQVLDNNHDLVNGNNFQGTGAGEGNTGVYVNGFGEGAATDNIGNSVNAFGINSGANNTGYNLNAFGYLAGNSNTGSPLNAFGSYAGAGNIGNEVNFLGSNSGNNNTGDAVNALGGASGQGNTGSSVNALGYAAAQFNSGNNVNFFGAQAGLSNTFNNVNLFGALAAADANNQNVFSKLISGVTKYLGRLSFNNITADRKWELPNASGTIALLSDIPASGVTSVGLTMPPAFTVTNSPITSSGDIAVTGAGLVSQYVRGDGTLANFPTSTGGGASVSYYLNGSVSQGTIGGIAYKEINGTPVIGTGTDFTINADGYIAQFITDVGDPNKLLIPAGNWNFETYFSASSGGGSPKFYIELYKYNGTTFTLIASNSATPENITGGTSIDLYFTALAIPQTTLLATDRLAVRFYVIHSGRTITMHTEDSHLSQIITTFSTGLTALNGLTDQVQFFDVGTGATNFNISSSGDTHTFNLLFNIRRNANNSSNNNINYNGYAVTGSAESSAVWTITRLTIAASGSITTATATNVAWTNRESAIYT